MNIALAIIRKTILDPLSPTFSFFGPPIKIRLNYVPVVKISCSSSFVFRNQEFIYFFTRAYSYGSNGSLVSESFYQIRHLHAWNFGDKYFSAFHNLEGLHHKFCRFVQSDPKSCHPLIGKRQSFASFYLTFEKRDYAPSTAYDISVSNNGKNRIFLPCCLAAIRISLNKKFFRAKFSGTVKINGMNRFIRT